MLNIANVFLWFLSCIVVRCQYKEAERWEFKRHLWFLNKTLQRLSMYFLVADTRPQLRVYWRRLRYRFEWLDKNCLVLRKGMHKIGLTLGVGLGQSDWSISDYETWRLIRPSHLKCVGLINLDVMKSHWLGLSLALVHKHVKWVKPLIHTNMSAFLRTNFFWAQFVWRDHLQLLVADINTQSILSMENKYI